LNCWQSTLVCIFRVHFKVPKCYTSTQVYENGPSVLYYLSKGCRVKQGTPDSQSRCYSIVELICSHGE
jgi:hypothetical protein